MLSECSILAQPFVHALHKCTQLRRLQLLQSEMSVDAAKALSSLTVMSQPQTLEWCQPQRPGESKVQQVLDSLAQLTQLTALVLAYNVVANDRAPLSSLITVPSKMVSLKVFKAMFVPICTTDGDSELSPVNLEFNSVWDRLPNPDLQHLLTSYHTLTHLEFNGLVLNQAGLDLLLAHPHIVNVTVLAIAATESRVDSPCSWHTLTLARQVDVRTVAYVPLHSLKTPLRIGSLLLPPDLDAEQLPHLLQAATTRMAAHKSICSLFVSPPY
jgi:hypothetical protein